VSSSARAGAPASSAGNRRGRRPDPRRRARNRQLRLRDADPPRASRHGARADPGNRWRLRSTARRGAGRGAARRGLPVPGLRRRALARLPAPSRAHRRADRRAPADAAQPDLHRRADVAICAPQSSTGASRRSRRASAPEPRRGAERPAPGSCVLRRALRVRYCWLLSTRFCIWSIAFVALLEKPCCRCSVLFAPAPNDRMITTAITTTATIPASTAISRVVSLGAGADGRAGALRPAD
jgi:hypothetical protein